MKLLLDNSGLHAAGRCLGLFSGEENKGLLSLNKEIINEIENLLNFIVQLVFSERIYILGSNTEGVTEKSDLLMRKLMNYGLEEDVFHFLPYEKINIERVCYLAGERSISSINSDVLKNTNSFSGLYPQMSKEVTNEYFADLHDLIVSNRTEEELIRRRICAIEAKVKGAVHLMILSHPELFKLIKNTVNSLDNWELKDTMKLHALLRIFFNDAIAETGLHDTYNTDDRATYSPNPLRSKMFLYLNYYQRLKFSLAHEFDKIIGKELRGALFSKELEITPIIGSLIIKSKGDPDGLFREALSLRGNTEYLRKTFSKFQKKLNSGEKGFQYVDKELGYMIRKYNNSMKKEPFWEKIPLLSAFFITDLGNIIELSKLLEPVSKIMKTLKSKSNKAITEAVFHYHGFYNEQYYNLLKSNCIKNIRKTV